MATARDREQMETEDQLPTVAVWVVVAILTFVAFAWIVPHALLPAG